MQVEKLMSSLRSNGLKPVALDEQIFSMIDRIIGTVAFGNIYGKDKFANFDNFQHVLHEAVDALSSFSAEDFFPKQLGRIVDRLTGVIARRERIFKQLDAFFEILIEQNLDPQRAKPENGSHDLVDFLLDILKEKSDKLNFTKDNVKAILYVRTLIFVLY
jgi:4-hydroxyphenylacetaldehyde oxime monooxygenase